MTFPLLRSFTDVSTQIYYSNIWRSQQRGLVQLSKVFTLISTTVQLLLADTLQYMTTNNLRFHYLPISLTVIHSESSSFLSSSPAVSYFSLQVLIWTQRWLWVSVCWARCPGEGWCPTASPSCWGLMWRQGLSTWSTMVRLSGTSNTLSLMGD